MNLDFISCVGYSGGYLFIRYPKYKLVNPSNTNPTMRAERSQLNSILIGVTKCYYVLWVTR